jgi:hypothetical protein
MTLLLLSQTLALHHKGLLLKGHDGMHDLLGFEIALVHVTSKN